MLAVCLPSFLSLFMLTEYLAPHICTWKADVADSKYNIAGLFETQGKRDEARKLFLECEQIYSKVYGPDHTETLDAGRWQARWWGERMGIRG